MNSKATTIIKQALFATVMACSFTPSARCGNVVGGISKYLFSTSTSDILLKGHEANITAAAFSPDGSLIATGAKDGEIIIRHANGKIKKRLIGKFNPTGQVIMMFLEHVNPIESLQFSDDSSMLVSAEYFRNIVRIWDMNNIDEAPRYLQVRGTIHRAFLSPDNTKIVLITKGDICGVRVLDLASGSCLLEKRDITDAAFIPESNNFLVTVSRTGESQYLNLETGERLSRQGYEYHFDYQTIGSQLSPDATKIGMNWILSNNDREFKIVDAAYNQVYPGIKTPSDAQEQITDLTFSPDSTKVIYATDLKTIYVWDIVAGMIESKIDRALSPHIGPMLNTDNTKILLVTQQDPSIAVLCLVPETEES